jgi:hypothetical protein
MFTKLVFKTGLEKKLDNYMPIIIKAARAITKGFLKAGNDNVKRFEKASR